MNTIPAELLPRIFTHLPPRTVYRDLSRTSRSFHAITSGTVPVGLSLEIRNKWRLRAAEAEITVKPLKAFADGVGVRAEVAIEKGFFEGRAFPTPAAALQFFNEAVTPKLPLGLAKSGILWHCSRVHLRFSEYSKITELDPDMEAIGQLFAALKPPTIYVADDLSPLLVFTQKTPSYFESVQDVSLSYWPTRKLDYDVEPDIRAGAIEQWLKDIFRIFPSTTSIATQMWCFTEHDAKYIQDNIPANVRGQIREIRSSSGGPCFISSDSSGVFRFVPVFPSLASLGDLEVSPSMWNNISDAVDTETLRRVRHLYLDLSPVDFFYYNTEKQKSIVEGFEKYFPNLDEVTIQYQVVLGLVPDNYELPPYHSGEGLDTVLGVFRRLFENMPAPTVKIVGPSVQRTCDVKDAGDVLEKVVHVAQTCGKVVVRSA
ncbi:hypothetical protein M427DRAFT_132658 [Gonapodya prolifera JEL478]|uniref:F-box domain-containing protein n=1 Tax=Gonapodya prolifera (strain JEL478) TaxID=1344416 RepID=A0A139APQ4_GONPJ|nr:hypothetical protein M427DRAFT_132658 [Gonapodya prolifera JEL478]|eukprot:KXS18737.1 hypothetical protein M427DRAFT_132658 [Gonapodya prolifera JEL478]